MDYNRVAKDIITRLEQKDFFPMPKNQGVTVEDIKTVCTQGGVTGNFEEVSGKVFGHIREAQSTIVAVLPGLDKKDPPMIWVCLPGEGSECHGIVSLLDYVEGNEKAALLTEIIGPYRQDKNPSRPMRIGEKLRRFFAPKKTP